MRFARRALQRKLAAHRLTECLAERHRGAANVTLRAIRVVRHRPPFRCLVEYDLDVTSIDGLIRRETLIGKVQARGADGPAYLLARDLWRAGFDGRDSRPFGVPEPLGLFPDLRLWLQAKVAGRSSFHLMSPPGGPALARRIAEAIHAFHLEAPRPTRIHGVAEEIAILRVRLERFVVENPPLAIRARSVLTRCERLAADIPEVELTTIHRDFHQDQVLVDGDRLWLLDMDEASQGDAALDVGNFVAHLWEQGVRMFGSAEALHDCTAEFVERYIALAGEEIRPRIEAFALVSFARHISLSSERPERRPFVEAVLQECERRLETGGALRYVKSPPSANS